ncbi:MAG: ABC transporter ATP-binding protein [Chitinophagales bacterium]|jgi:lipoprotein-releasing system ATP-binding protein|nr:ABC transporter ATP-binding protein [Chitinophagales bacterium]
MSSSQSNDACLIGKKLKKSYGDFVALDIDYIAVEKHKITSIVGSSGAGKSTLLHALGTLMPVDSGEIWLQDKNLVRLDSKELAHIRNLKFGFVFQHHQLIPELSALENIALPALIAKKNKEAYMPRVNELIQFMGITHRANHKPNEMSGGEQQRVAICRALVNEPEIVLLDEPTGNLDSANYTMIHELFQQLNREFQQTFLIVTHNQELAKLSHRIIEIKDGKIKSED